MTAKVKILFDFTLLEKNQQTSGFSFKAQESEQVFGVELDRRIHNTLVLFISED